MSTKDYGCFFCSEKSPVNAGQCPSCGKPIDISALLLGLEIDSYRITRIVGRGFHGWTVRAEDEYQAFAIKIIPEHRVKVEFPDAEARNLAACSPHRNIARFFRAGPATLPIEGGVRVRYLVFEFIENARPLSALLSDQSVALTRNDVVTILTGIASGLARLHSKALWHYDLHDDNILVREVPPDENLAEGFEAKLIDFGSSRTFSPASVEHQERSDYSYLSKHIYVLTTRFEVARRMQLTPADRAFASRLRTIGQRLADTNVSRRNLAPLDVANALRAALTECTGGNAFPSFEEMKSRAAVSLVEPLSNVNALNLAPQDVALLFRDSLGWKHRVEKSEPVLVLGPRGCGKTMLLRFLSIGSAARPLDAEATPEDVGLRLRTSRHIGFLINVGQLRTPFIRSAFKTLASKDAPRAEDFCREYLSLNLAYEVIRSLAWLNSESIVSLGPDEVSLVAGVAAQLLHPEVPAPATLEACTELLERRVMDLSSLSAPDAYVPTNFCRDDVLHLLAQALRRTSVASDKEIWFLFDDYSITVLPALAQKAYNPVLFRPSSELRIKMSSEGDGPILTDTLDRKYREGREVTRVNLGEVYFQAKEEEARRFFENILEARFRSTRKGSLKELQQRLGEHEHDKSFGEYIARQTRPGDARFYGFSLICRLCSGDVSFIIELLNQLIGGAWNGSGRAISPTEQDEVVKRFAQRQLAELHAISEYGERLYDVATRFGELIKHYLLKSKDKTRADERLRIEIEGEGDLCLEAQAIHHALLRYSVLVPGGFGKSRTGMPTAKYYFRRLFAPCFPFSPNRRSTIAVTRQTYEAWLLDPKQIWRDPPPELPFSQ